MKTTNWQLFVDGASRNNPGPAGAGIYLAHKHQAVISQGFFLGVKTNNQAEYLALLIGLMVALPKIGDEHLQIVSDSLLLVNQIKGIYRVKNPQLKLIHEQIMAILSEVSYDVVHVLRAKNQIADEMANVGIDEKVAIPSKIKEKLKHHAVEI